MVKDNSFYRVTKSFGIWKIIVESRTIHSYNIKLPSSRSILHETIFTTVTYVNTSTRVGIATAKEDRLPRNHQIYLFYGQKSPAGGKISLLLMSSVSLMISYEVKNNKLWKFCSIANYKHMQAGTINCESTWSDLSRCRVVLRGQTLFSRHGAFLR